MKKNIYIAMKEEIFDICNGAYDGRKYDIGVGLDIFDSIYNLPHNDLARAQLHEHLNIPMSDAYKDLLKEEKEKAAE